MPLMPGSHIGPYEVVAAIGAGGMGEVFRVRDMKLKRDVAIKVLPAAFAQDHERVARFKREAQVLASLNHPNIAANSPDGRSVLISTASVGGGEMTMVPGSRLGPYEITTAIGAGEVGEVFRPPARGIWPGTRRAIPFPSVERRGTRRSGMGRLVSPDSAAAVFGERQTVGNLPGAWRIS